MTAPMKTEERQLWAAALVAAVIVSILVSGSITALAIAPLKKRLAVAEEKPTPKALPAVACECSEQWRRKVDRELLLLYGWANSNTLWIVGHGCVIEGRHKYSEQVNQVAFQWFKALEPIQPLMPVDEYRKRVRQVQLRQPAASTPTGSR